MRRVLLFLILLSCYTVFLHAQDAVLRIDSLHRIYEIEITFLAEPNSFNGAIFQLRDSSITVSSSVVKEDYLSGTYELSELYIKDIQSIYSEKSLRKISGAFIGAGVGFLIGFVIGNMQGVEPCSEYDLFCPTAKQKGLMVGVTVSLAGGLSGMLLGSHSSKMPINGGMYHYKSYEDRLKKYSILK